MKHGQGKISKMHDVEVQALRKRPDGLRFKELYKIVMEQIPGSKDGAVRGSLRDLPEKRPNDVYKPGYGLFRHVHFRESSSSKMQSKRDGTESPRNRHGEESYYAPFARWLQDDISECTRAIPLGGNVLASVVGKWGTPDAVGILESGRGDIYSPPIELVSAEIKTNSSKLVEAFGQACSYKLFSHKSYLVIPAESSREDLARLDSLCLVFGIGLVHLNMKEDEIDAFTVRVRAARHHPDAVYVNRVLQELKAKTRLLR